MSAFIVSKHTIDALVTAWIELADQHSTPNRIERREQADDVGRMLWSENRKSVDYLYRETNVAEIYRFESLPFRRTPETIAAVFSLADCYVYQSCEHPGWQESKAREWIDRLRSDAWHRLPGYENGPRDAHNRNVFLPPSVDAALPPAQPVVTAAGQGAKYDAKLSKKEIAARVRTEVRGKLPAGVKVSVRLQRSSTSSSIHARVTAVPDGFRILNPEAVACTLPACDHYRPEAAAIIKTIQDALDAYNFDRSDPMTDYFNVNFYSSVDFDWRLETADRQRILTDHAPTCGAHHHNACTCGR